MIVLDASIILKWILDDEPHAGSARDYRDRHLAGVDAIAVPELLFYEIANALATRASLSPGEAVEGFIHILDMELVSHRLSTEVFTEAIRFSKRFKISLYDGSYISLAEALGCDFITADARLVSKAKGLRRIKLLN